MPAAARISVVDGKQTPVTHHFDPNAVESSSATLANAAASTLAGREKLVVTVRPAAGNTPGKVSIRMSLPTETTQTDGTIAVSQFQTVICEFLVNSASTAAMRKDMRVLLKNLLDNASIIDVVENLAPIY